MILKLKYVFFEHVAVENAYSVNNNQCTTKSEFMTYKNLSSLLHFMPCI